MAAGTLPGVTVLLAENAVPMALAGALNPMDDVVTAAAERGYGHRQRGPSDLITRRSIDAVGIRRARGSSLTWPACLRPSPIRLLCSADA